MRSSGYFEKIATFIVAVSKNKWVGMISGWGIWSASSMYYGRIVYPGLMLMFGNIYGGAVAGLGAMLICLAFLLYYEASKSVWISSTEDIFGGMIQRIQKIEEYNMVLKVLLYIPRLLMQYSLQLIATRGKIGFIVLSCMSDPFVTLSFFKNGREGLTKKDWVMFLTSGVIANVYWSIYTAIILEFVKAGWGLLMTIIWG